MFESNDKIENCRKVYKSIHRKKHEKVLKSVRKYEKVW